MVPGPFVISLQRRPILVPSPFVISLQKCVVNTQINRRHGDGHRLRQRCRCPQQRADRLLTYRLLLLQQLHQRRLDTCLAFHAGQVQQPHVLLVGPGRLLRQQGVIGTPIGQGRIQLLAVHIAGECSRLTHQPADDVPVVDPVLVLAAQARHPLDQLPGVPDLDLLQPQAGFDLFADQPRRHRVSVVFHPDRAPPAHTHPQALQRLQPSRRQRTQAGVLSSHRTGPAGIALVLHRLQQRHVVFTPGEIPAAPQQQGLLDGLLEMPVRRLHVAILIPAGRVGRLPLQAVMRQQGPIGVRELVGVAIVVDGQCHAIGPVALRHTAQGPQGVLQAGAQAGEALGKTKSDMLPIGMRQHEMVQQVWQGLALNGHLQVVHRREVGSGQPAGSMHLGKEHFLGRPVLGLPLPHASFQGPPRRLGTCARLGALHPVPQGLGLQAWLLLQLLGHGRPYLGERVRPGPPGSRLARLRG